MRDEMKLTMNAIAENEYFARVAVAAFSAKMDHHGRTCRY